MSMTTSLCHRSRYSKAKCAAHTQASGSSPLTCRIGACTVRATSVGYVDERWASAVVVKPTWLLMIRWTVPPTSQPLIWLMWSVSLTTPWPAKAASPWISSGSTENGCSSLLRSCMARVTPSTTGLTASRCDGLAASLIGTLLPWRDVKTPSMPRWYLTSPLPWIESSSIPTSNSRNSCWWVLPTMLTSTLSRPRWAMPSTT